MSLKIGQIGKNQKQGGSDEKEVHGWSIILIPLPPSRFLLDLDIEIHGIDPWIWNLVTPHGIDLRRKLEQILRSLDFRYRL